MGKAAWVGALAGGHVDRQPLPQEGHGAAGGHLAGWQAACALFRGPQHNVGAGGAAGALGRHPGRAPPARAAALGPPEAQVSVTQLSFVTSAASQGTAGHGFFYCRMAGVMHGVCQSWLGM